jgi:hypothetical protein
MPTRAELNARITELQRQLDDCRMSRVLDAEKITSLETKLAECEDTTAPAPEPTPTPTPTPPTGTVPSGSVIAKDDCTLGTADAISRLWIGHTGVKPPRVEHHTTGGPNNGPYRRFLLSEGDRDASEPAGNERNEFGNNSLSSSFVHYKPGMRCVTRSWHRLPEIAVGTGIGEGRTLMQMKHAGPNPIAPSPPLAVDQIEGGRLRIRERSRTDTTIRGVIPFQVGAWFELAQDIVYSLTQGHIDAYLNGRKLVSVNCPTLKVNTSGQVMESTLRVGIYQSAEIKAGPADLGPVRVERIA